MRAKNSSIIPVEAIDRRILMIRGHRVIIDADLAELYRVPTKALNQAVKRNAERFPEDFAFRLTAREKEQVVTNCDHLSKLRFTRMRPNAFTEHGALMAANVLSSPCAVLASVAVVRAFIRLRQALSTQRKLALRFIELERRVGHHDTAIVQLMEAIRELMDPPSPPPRERIGFHPLRKGRNARRPR